MLTASAAGCGFLLRRMTRINWQRFWVPDGAGPSLLDRGFLADPTMILGAYAPDVVPFADIADTRCLVLIGEPGAGKTDALESEFQATRLELARGDAAMSVDLGRINNRTELREDIFESPSFLRWRRGTHRLCLFIDALDEARLGYRTVGEELAEGFVGVETGRLWLRISCRSADRHQALEARLEELFGANDFGVYRLAPLRIADVVTASEARGVDPSVFLHEVTKRSLEPFARKPLTLMRLLALYGADGALPNSQSELYEEFVLLLCREPDEQRRAAGAFAPSPEERFTLAARIAAGALLAGRDTIVASGQAPQRGGDVALRELEGGTELNRLGAVATPVDASVSALGDALGTGLFSSRGTGRFGWDHQTDAEFLAAHFLAKGGIRDRQIVDLLMRAEGGRSRVIPQLRNVAGWVVALRPSFADCIDPLDGEVLLLSDPDAVSPDRRRAALRGILDGVGDGRLDRWEVRRLFGSLGYEGLADDLREYIGDRERPPRSRQSALDAVAETAVPELGDLLVEVALDDHDQLEVRIAALYALRGGATPEQARRLRPLAVEALQFDQDDELKGAALAVCWPEVLTPHELFASLTPPKRPNLLGAYKSFLWNEVVSGLAKSGGLLEALRWAAGVPRAHAATDAFSALADEIVLAAWPRAADDDAIADALADNVLASMRAYAPVLSSSGGLAGDRAGRERILANPDTRRRLVERLLPGLALDEGAPMALLSTTPALVDRDDVEWVAEKLRAAVGGPNEPAWAELAEVLLVHTSRTETLYELRRASAILRELTGWRFDAVPIKSEEAERARDVYARHERLLRDQNEPTEPFDPAVGVSELLDRFEAGDRDAYWRLQPHLFADERGELPHLAFVSDISAARGWARLGQELKERVVAAALDYLEIGEPEPERWIGQENLAVWPAWAGYRALRLSATVAPGRLDELGDEVWRRWASIIVAWPGEGEGEDRFRTRALKRLREVAPDLLALYIGRILDSELAAKKRYLNAVRRAEDAWAPELELVLLERAQQPLSPHNRAEILAVLVRDGSTAGRHLCEELVSTEALAAGGQRRETAIEVAVELAEHADDAGWPTIWPLIEIDDEFGRSLISRLASDREVAISERLSPAAVGELWEWTVRQFPVEQDPDERSGVVTGRMSIGWWRDRLFRDLVSQGTPETVAELRRLQDTFPQYPWLRSYSHIADEQRRRGEWTPPSPGAVVGMAADANRRYVASASELQRLVLEILTEAQGAMHDEYHLVSGLWNASPRKPKPENDISDRLRQFLHDRLVSRGVLVDRELQVLPGTGSGVGQRTDIHVRAMGDRDAAFTVIIEVKPTWNKDVDSKLEDQLVEDYLRATGTDHGIYLVLWFSPDDWDENDRERRRQAGRRTLEATKRFFENQAKEVSMRRGVEVDAIVLDASLKPR
jgi:hypothetical protein